MIIESRSSRQHPCAPPPRRLPWPWAPPPATKSDLLHANMGSLRTHGTYSYEKYQAMGCVGLQSGSISLSMDLRDKSLLTRVSVDASIPDRVITYRCRSISPEDGTALRSPPVHARRASQSTRYCLLEVASATRRLAWSWILGSLHQASDMGMVSARQLYACVTQARTRGSFSECSPRAFDRVVDVYENRRCSTCFPTPVGYTTTARLPTLRVRGSDCSSVTRTTDSWEIGHRARHSRVLQDGHIGPPTLPFWQAFDRLPCPHTLHTPFDTFHDPLRNFRGTALFSVPLRKRGRPGPPHSTPALGPPSAAHALPRMSRTHEWPAQLQGAPLTLRYKTATSDPTPLAR